MTDQRGDLHTEIADRPGPPPELRDASPRRSRALGVFLPPSRSRHSPLLFGTPMIVGSSEGPK